jgi:hypothetical protein
MREDALRILKMIVVTFGQRCTKLRRKTLSMKCEKRSEKEGEGMFPLGTIKTTWQGSEDPVPWSMVLVTF